ncbi:prenylated Rab acceptor protein 1-like [Patiria miniata]|uniref:PRA1 family protein n=1 Tax=Patiria miniata TaxID=46514 RepID=A0A914AP78_PATMI|nr:prenylated Rab acceptor protein 1-like [Patiria miniata]
MAEVEEEISGDIVVPLSDEKTGMSITLSNAGAREWIQKKRASVRPWTEFLKTSQFSRPKGVKEVTTRVVANIETYQSNYLFVFVGLLVYCLITSPLLIVALVVLFGACYWIRVKNESKKLSLLGYEFTLFQQYGAVALLSFPLFFVAGATSAVFWVIGASFFFIMLHAVMFEPIAEQDDEEITMEEVSFGQ